MRPHDLAHQPLLADQRLRRIHPDQSELLDELLVLLADQTLEPRERDFGVRRESEVEASLVVLQLRTAATDASDGLGQRHVEVERERRLHGERVELPEPLTVDTANRIARERR